MSNIMLTWKYIGVHRLYQRHYIRQYSIYK